MWSAIEGHPEVYADVMTVLGDGSLGSLLGVLMGWGLRIRQLDGQGMFLLPMLDLEDPSPDP